MVRGFRAMTFPSYKRSWKQEQAYLAEQPLDERLRALGIPAIAIFGEHDRFFHARESAAAFAAVPAVRGGVLPGVGHSPNIERPEEVAQLVRELAAGPRCVMARDLRLVVGAVGLSALGDALAFVPLVLHLEGESGSGPAVAALLIALWGPVALLAPVAGALVDRVETRSLLLGVSLAQAAVVAVLAFVSAPGAVIALAALVGIGFAIAQPAEFALVPVVAGPETRAGGERARRDGALPRLAARAAARRAARGGRRDPRRAAGERRDLRRRGDRRVRPARAARADALPPATSAGGRATASPSCSATECWRWSSRSGSSRSCCSPPPRPPRSSSLRTTSTRASSATAALITAWTVGMGFGATLVARRVPKRLLAVGALVAVAVQGAGMAGGTVHFWCCRWCSPRS